MQHDQSRREGRLQQKSGGATQHLPDLKHENTVHIARRSKTILIIVLFLQQSSGQQAVDSTRKTSIIRGTDGRHCPTAVR
jgi:hypothetical protein